MDFRESILFSITFALNRCKAQLRKMKEGRDNEFTPKFIAEKVLKQLEQSGYIISKKPTQPLEPSPYARKKDD